MINETNAYEEIRRRSLQLVEDAHIDPNERGQIRELVTQAVDEYRRRSNLGENRAISDPGHMVERIVRSVSDFGPLTDLLWRTDLEEIFIEGPRVTFIDGTGRLRGLEEPTTLEENRQVVDRLLAATDRRLDASSPIVQSRVLDGTARLTAVIPPIADQLSATIRRYALRKESLASLVELGSLTGPAASFLWAVMQTNSSVMISGPPGAGKTSLLSAMLNASPAAHCLRCCEEVRELHFPLIHGSFYEARPPGLDGSGEVSLRDLVKVVLAMRPDRIVVGEVRGAEAFELTRAVNAGTGFACTIHANSAADALTAMVNAALMAGENVPEGVVRNVFAASLDLVVHLDRESIRGDEGGLKRQVLEILAVVPSLHDDFSTEPIFVRDRVGGALRWTGALPPRRLATNVTRLLPDGVALNDVLDGRVSLP